MIWREVAGRVVSWILPWPRKRDRRAAVERAWQAASESRKDAVKAEALTRELERVAKNNHFAESIARQLREGR